jgi:hypothetical protein
LCDYECGKSKQTRGIKALFIADILLVEIWHNKTSFYTTLENFEPLSLLRKLKLNCFEELINSW